MMPNSLEGIFFLGQCPIESLLDLSSINVLEWTAFVEMFDVVLSYSRHLPVSYFVM